MDTPADIFNGHAATALRIALLDAGSRADAKDIHSLNILLSQDGGFMDRGGFLLAERILGAIGK